MSETPISRRAMLAGIAVTAGGALLPQIPAATSESTPPVVPADPSAVPGGGTTPISARSPFEHPARTPVGVITGPAFTPIHELTGTITPNDLVFERHHAGVAVIDPKRY